MEKAPLTANTVKIPGEAHEQAAGFSLVCEFPQDGSIVLKNRMTVSGRDEAGAERRLETERLVIRNYDSGEELLWKQQDIIGADRELLIRGGVLSQGENGEILIEGSAEEPVRLELVMREEGTEQPQGFLIAYEGQWPAAETMSAAQTPAPPSPAVPETPGAAELPVPPASSLPQAELPAGRETVSVSWENGDLLVTNTMTLHAESDEGGWQVEERAESLLIRGCPEGRAIAEEAAAGIGTDRMLSVSGGVCTRDGEQGGFVIEADAEHPLEVRLTTCSADHETHEGVCVEYRGTLGPIPESGASAPSPLTLIGTALLAALLGAGAATLLKRKKKTGAPQKTPPEDNGWEEAEPQQDADKEPAGLNCGQLQHIGKRPSQQDSAGLYGLSGGVLAVVADGMGGLKNGDVVSRKIVQTMGTDAKNLSAAQAGDNLPALVAHANDEVNRMLGQDELYKCGSTLAAVVAEPQQFRWAAVGDSRIYLFRAGRLLQLNREHNYAADLLLYAVNRQLSFQEARNDPKRKRVTSFIGMGALRYVDGMQRPVRTVTGDRILICSDGVFNTLSEQKIEAVLAESPDAKTAAETLEAAVLEANNPYQDNFTALILSYD